MARAPDPRIEQAKAMYLKGQKLIEIASHLNLPEGTVRRWKCTHKWDSERSDKNSERSVRKKERSEPSENKKKEVAADVDHILENTELTDKQRLFCSIYIRCFNATKAYQKAYKCSYEVANAEGYRLLVNPCIRNEIKQLKKNRLNREMLDEEDIFQKYMDIAFADLTDYLEFGQKQVNVMGMYGPVQVKDPDTGKKVPLMEMVNFVRFRDSTEVDGTIISEIKQGKDGASIKLADRMKALQWLSDHMDLATEKQRAETELLKAKMTETLGSEADAVEVWIDSVSEENILDNSESSEDG